MYLFFFIISNDVGNVIIVAIIERLNQFHHELNNKDLNLLDDLYTEDACVVKPGANVICLGNKTC